MRERESYEIRGSHTENRPPFKGFFKNQMILRKKERNFIKFAVLRQKCGSFAVDRQEFGHSFNGMISFSKQLGAAAKSSALCSGREYQYFAVFRQKYEAGTIDDHTGKGNPTKFAVFIQKIGLLLKSFAKTGWFLWRKEKNFMKLAVLRRKIRVICGRSAEIWPWF